MSHRIPKEKNINKDEEAVYTLAVAEAVLWQGAATQQENFHKRVHAVGDFLIQRNLGKRKIINNTKIVSLGTL